MNEELGLILTEMKKGFAEVNQRLDGMNQRLDGMNQRLNGIDQRFKAVDQRLDAIDQGFKAIDQRLGGMNDHLDGIEREVVIQKQAGKNSENISEFKMKIGEQARMLTTLSVRSIVQEGELRTLKEALYFKQSV